MMVKGKPISSKHIGNVLLIQLGDIGDVVLSLPAVRALRENFPQNDVVVAVREKAAELVEDCPWATGVISVEKKERGPIRQIVYQKDFFLRLRRFQFDLAIDMRTGSRSALLALLSGARRRVGFYAGGEEGWRNRVFTHLMVDAGRPGQHMAEYYSNLLTACNLEAVHVWPEHPIPGEKQMRAMALLAEQNVSPESPIVAVQPFSLWEYKEWGVQNFIRLINRIGSEYNLPIIITGSAGEREKAEDLIRSCRAARLYNLAGKTSIGMLAAVLKACAVFVGGDSAGIHIAAAVGTPTVSIFGPSSSVAWSPRGEQHRVVQKRLHCVPCHQKGCQGSGVSRCLEELTVAEVFAVVKEQIDKVIASQRNRSVRAPSA